MSRKRDSPAKVKVKNGYLYAITKRGEYRIKIDIFNSLSNCKKERNK